MGPKVEKEGLYERYSTLLLAVCLRYVANKYEAEDLLHDSYIKIFEHLEDCEFKNESALFSWMRRISVNKCIDCIRGRRYLLLPLEASMDVPSEDSIDPDSVSPVPLDVLLNMVANLPDGYRTVFNLYCLEGYSHSQIAKRLGIKEKTSSSQYFRARQLLSQKIHKYLYEKGKKK